MRTLQCLLDHLDFWGHRLEASHLSNLRVLTPLWIEGPLILLHFPCSLVCALSFHQTQWDRSPEPISVILGAFLCPAEDPRSPLRAVMSSVKILTGFSLCLWRLSPDALLFTATPVPQDN